MFLQGKLKLTFFCLRKHSSLQALFSMLRDCFWEFEAINCRYNRMMLPTPNRADRYFWHTVFAIHQGSEAPLLPIVVSLESPFSLSNKPEIAKNDHLTRDGKVNRQSLKLYGAVQRFQPSPSKNRKTVELFPCS